MTRGDAFYRNILDSLRPASLSALIDVADGYWMAVFEWPFIMRALESRGLVQFNLGTDPAVGDIAWKKPPAPVTLTVLGAEFVRWYRGRDINLPVQERLL